MTNPIKIAVVRGMGLAFPIACLWYVFSGDPSVFSLVLVGAVLGFTVGVVLKRFPGLKTKSPAVLKEIEPRSTRQTGLMKYLAHENPIIRFASLVAVGILLFLPAWYIGYYLLPEGIFRGGAEAHMARSQLATSSASVFEEWTRIFTANLIPVLIILLGGLLIRVNGLTFGYLIALFNLVGYGLFVGTNSFAIPYPERLAPSLEILSRSGPYEMLALVLLATSSCFWPFFEIKRIFYTSVERVEHGPRFSRKDAIGFGIGLFILIAANWLEAVMIMSTG
jgi:hypothetical protein